MRHSNLAAGFSTAIWLAVLAVQPAWSCSCERTPTPTDESAVPASPGSGCVASGGTVTEQLCCGSAADFPNTCLVGACGCAPSASHTVQACQCGEDHCFDGTRCVAR